MKAANLAGQEGRSPDIVNYIQGRAYTCGDVYGFFTYCRDVLGYKDMDQKLHMRLCQHVMDPAIRKMLLVFRGSFKSSIANTGYITWKIAKEFIETGSVNRRYMIASEKRDISVPFVGAVRLVMEQNERWKELFGDHEGDQAWTNIQLTSRYKSDTTKREPTVSSIAIDAPRTGWHVDELILDDVQGETFSANRGRIDSVWRFYRLLHSILEPEFAEYPGKMTIIGTRWHYDDIYERIIKRDVAGSGKKRYQTLVQPAIDTKGKAVFPKRFPLEALDQLKREQGSFIFGSQYLLDPIPDEKRTFSKASLLYTTPEDFRRQDFRFYTGVDFAFTEQSKIDTGEIRDSDFTVIATVGVDPQWHYYLVECKRERYTKLQGALEAFRQCNHWKSIKLACQKYDRAQMKEFMDHVKFDWKGKPTYTEWIAYPSNRTKQDRIVLALQPLFERGAFHILPGLSWLEDELLEFPLGMTDDGLDALCNVVAITRPPRGLQAKKDDDRKFPLLKDWNRMLKGIRDPSELGRSTKFRFQNIRKTFKNS